jgi:hypothetical protein
LKFVFGENGLRSIAIKVVPLFTLLFGNKDGRSKTGYGSSATTRQEEMLNYDLTPNIF